MKLLTFNCGSSSLKIELLELESAIPAKRLARGVFEEIGDHTDYRLTDSHGAEVKGSGGVSDHPSAALNAIEWLEHGALLGGLAATVHRVVHGGDEITGARITDDAVLQAIERASIWAPLHNPPALAAIRAVSNRLGGLPVVVLADTAFHRHIPDYARNYAIPHDLAARHGIRRFGFHGIGHAWMLERCAGLIGRSPGHLNLITLQLGGGSSACAIRQGRSVDTSMGMSPLEGLVMETRTGDLDPSIVTYLMKAENLSPDEMDRTLNHGSGMLGVSGVSGDVRKLHQAEQNGNRAAALALEMFCYRVRKYIGAYTAALGQVDAVAFGGGIGEHDAAVRRQICSGLESIGVRLDEKLNQDATGNEARISAPDSPTRIFAIPLDEELYMARAAFDLLSASRKFSSL
ncbi:MAG: acetate/propionate family kinase [Candidatus Binataceae bacterium]